MGVPLSADSAEGRPLEGSDAELWRRAADALLPDRSMERMADSAKFVVSTLALVGSILTGFGLLASDRIVENKFAVGLAVSALASVFVALLCALDFLRMRIGEVNIHNLVEVKEWYEQQLSRGWRVYLSGWLLLLAVSLAGSSAIVTFASNPTNSPGVTMQASRATPSGWNASGTVICDSCRSKETYRITMSAKQGNTVTQCFAANVYSDNDGKFKLDVPVCLLTENSIATLYVDGTPAATMTAG
jgi:hypothetical protein